jgi:hypothetical protein
VQGTNLQINSGSANLYPGVYNGGVNIDPSGQPVASTRIYGLVE